ncbi:MAG TPA: Rieske (2Fe-2S) protein [Pseudonocardiaceae bacterium]|nr:Rieske (2Fe-2S) protein [Pseudonocardiaceae bacterium]
MTTARDVEPAQAGNSLPTCSADCAAGRGLLGGGQVSRRRLMRGAAIAGGVVAAGVGLAACGGGASSSSAPAGPTVLGKTSDIPVGGGVIYAAQHVVITQPVAGTFKGFSSTCTHLGCTVDRVSGGLIMCPCHGSAYSVVDGSVKDGPAPKPLPAERITIKGTQVILDA